MIHFEVVGVPAPQGSKKHVGNGIMVESSKKLKPWRDAVADAAKEAMGGREPYDQAMRLAVEFRMPMPQSRRKRDRLFGMLWAEKKPDIDKILRATLDAMKTGGVYSDDARVVEVYMVMVEVNSWTGARIELDTAPNLAEQAGAA